MSVLGFESPQGKQTGSREIKEKPQTRPPLSDPSPKASSDGEPALTLEQQKAVTNLQHILRKHDWTPRGLGDGPTLSELLAKQSPEFQRQYEEALAQSQRAGELLYRQKEQELFPDAGGSVPT